MKKRISLLLVVMMLLSIVLIACGDGGSSDKGEDGNNNVDTEVSGLDEIINSGKIVLGTSADYPPFEFHTMVDGKDTIVGLDLVLILKLQSILQMN